MKLPRKLRNIIAGITTPFLLGTPAVASDWATLQPAYNASDEQATVRLEGAADLGAKWKFYGFIDADIFPNAETDVQTYGEARLRRMLTPTLGALAEYNAGFGSETVRLGLQWDPRIGKKNLLSLKGTHSDTGPQFGIYTRRQFTPKFSASALGEYNFDQETAYGELEMEIQLQGPFSAFGQARISDSPEKTTVTPVVGFKYAL